MVAIVEEKHNNNLVQINGILTSMDEYLGMMNNVWDYRLKKNRVPAIAAYKKTFVDLRDNLVTSFANLVLYVYKLYLLKSNTDTNYEKGIEDLIKLLPLTSNIELIKLGYNATVLGQSNAPLIDIIKQRIKDGRDDINNLISQLILSIQNYTKCISELENAKTANFESMGLVESILFKENNKFGRKLTDYIISRKFDGIPMNDMKEFLGIEKQ